MLSPILSLALLVLGSGFFMSFISVHLHDLAATDAQIGRTQGAFYLGLLFSTLRSEHLIMRVGHIRALTATCGLLASVTLMMYLTPLSAWPLMRCISGACVGCFYVGVESWLLAEYGADKRGLAMAMYTIAMYTAQAISQLFLGFTDNHAPIAFIISALFISLAVLPVSIGKSSGPTTRVAEPASLLKFLHRSPVGVGGCMLAGMILSTIYTFLPLVFQNHESFKGAMMFWMVGGGAVLQYPIGTLSDRFERRWVLAIIAAAAVVVAIFLPFTTDPRVFTLGIFLLGGLTFTIYPVAMAIGCDRVLQHEIVTMTGVLLFAYGIGAVCGPVISPYFSFLGPNSPLFAIGVYSSCIILVATYSIRGKKMLEIPAAKVEFSILPTGPIVEELHPNTKSDPPTQNLN